VNAIAIREKIGRSTYAEKPIPVSELAHLL
jgi:hypothetical protein